MEVEVEESSFKLSKYLGSRKSFYRKLSSILIGDLICAFAINFFFQQKGLLSGGIGGIGLLLKFLYDIPTGLTMLILNIPLVILGYIFINKKFTTYAMISAFVISMYLLILEKVPNPFLIKDSFLVAVIGGAINGIGMGILFRNGTCQGGLDILAVFFKDRLNMNIGNALLAMNTFIILFASYVFSLERGLYTVVSMVVAYNLLDKIQLGMGEKKQVFIVTSKYDEVSEAIMNKLVRGVTYFQGEGAFTQKEQKIIYTVVTTRELAKLKKMVEKIDDKAFVTISEAYEVKGKGFTTAEI